MSYLFDRVVNESYTYDSYNSDISDPTELSVYCNECATDFYKTEAAMYRLETNNICALIEARYANDIGRIHELNCVMEGFFGNLFQSIINFVKKIINAIINFFKKLFSSSGSSSGGGGGSSTRSDGKPIVEKEKADSGEEKTTLHITVYPIENVANKIEEIINEALTNLRKISDAIFDKSELLFKIVGRSNSDINSSINKLFSNKLGYLTRDKSEYNKIASEFVTKDPLYKNTDVEPDKFDLHFSIDTYKAYTSKKTDKAKKSLYVYETNAVKILDALSKHVDSEIKKINDEAGKKYLDSEYDREDKEEQEYLKNKEKEKEKQFPLRSVVRHASKESMYYTFSDFLTVMEEITVHGASIRQNKDLSQVLQNGIKLCKELIIRSTHMIKSGSVQLASIVDKDIKQYIHIYNTINKK